jgi:hypothetical protein
LPQVARRAAREQVRRGSGQAVAEVRRVRDAVAIAVDAVVRPGRRHELAVADGAGRARPHVRAEAAFHLGDSGQYLPRDAGGCTDLLHHGQVLGRDLRDCRG